MGFKARGAGTPCASSIPADLDHVFERHVQIMVFKCRFCPTRTFERTRWLAEGPCAARRAAHRLGIRQRNVLELLDTHGPWYPGLPWGRPKGEMIRLLRRLESLGFVDLDRCWSITSEGLAALKELRP